MIPVDSIDYCRDVLRRSGSTFAMAFKVLPPHQRDAMTAFYAFCRLVDDAVDESGDTQGARAEVARWSDRLDKIYSGKPEGQVDLALSWAVEHFGIQKRHLELILEGVAQDISVRTYDSFDDLYEYCYRVASSVGLVCVSILGELDAELELYAELTGIAVQLTNILRDVGEDAQRGRIYIPLQDLEAFGVSRQQLLEGREDEALDDLFRFEVARTRHYYNMAQASLPGGRQHELFFAETLRETYLKLFDRLEQFGVRLDSPKVSLKKSEKIGIAAKRRLHPGTIIAAMGRRSRLYRHHHVGGQSHG